MKNLIRSIPILRRLDDYTNTPKGRVVGILLALVLWLVLINLVSAFGL